MLVLQDPSNPNSTYLLESVLEACSDANLFRGMFAFASSAGINLLANSPAFRSLIQRNAIELVVGIDAVTNLAALDALSNLIGGSGSTMARAFLNPRSDVIFHPKLCWTQQPSGGSLITGSGNLTEAGLLGNWEAYSFESLTTSQLADVSKIWDEWIDRHEDYLLPLNDEEVRRRASDNNIMARQGDLPFLKAANANAKDKTKTGSAAQGPANLFDSSDVLVAEIPKSGDRWKQANFDKHNYENFFGARVGEQRLVIFRHVDASGNLSPYQQSRPSVEVASQNYRFELDAAAGLAYPASGRPIGIFVRVATRTFYYHLLMPGQPQYPTVLAILNNRDTTSSVRRETMTGATLRAEWPNAPFWAITE